MTNEAIILAGGAGTRLKSVVSQLPKPMAPVHGKPFLEYLLAYLAKNHITRVVLSVGYQSEHIQRYFGNRFGPVELHYAVEKEALGTGGGVKLALQRTLNNQVFVVNGDTLFNVDLQKISEFHRQHGASLTIALHKVNDGSRYGSITTNNENRIIQFEEKKQDSGPSFINGGTYLLSKNCFLSVDLPRKFSFEKDFLETHYRQQAFYGLPFDDYFIDIGIPETYQKAQHDFLNLVL